MIAQVTGVIDQVEDRSVLLRVDGLSYEILVPASLVEYLRRHQMNHPGGSITLHTIYYLEGGVGMGNLFPRLLGFLNPKDRDFFELFTRVPGIGIKRALRCLALPIRRIACAIEEGDVGSLISLPEVGRRTAEKIIAELKGKMYEFALRKDETALGISETLPDLRAEAIEIFLQLGYKKSEAEMIVQGALGRNPKLDSVDALVQEVFRGEKRTEPPQNSVSGS